MSSSLLAPSMSTLGRMVTGGTGSTLTIRSSGRHPMSSTSWGGRAGQGGVQEEGGSELFGAGPGFGT
jgi:hypothetical protein